MRTVTALTLQKRNKERVNVFLDGAYAFSLSLHAATTLKRGDELSQADIARLQREDEVYRAYQQALRLVGYRPRSQDEIERRLHRKGYDADAIAPAIERLRANRYLDDDAFARYWLDHRERFRPRGARALRHELRQKGVDRDIIDTVLTEVDEEASAWAVVAGKLDRWQGLDEAAFRKKVAGWLSRRGFGYDTIRTVWRRGWDAVQQSNRQ